MIIILIICTAINIICIFFVQRAIKKRIKITELKNIEAINSLQTCNAHLLITSKGEGLTVNYSMDEKDIIRIGIFLQNYFGQTEANMDEIKNILK